VICKSEAVTNSLGVKENSIIELLIVSVCTFTAVKENWEFDSQFSCLGTSLKNLRQKVVDLRGEVLLVNHVKSDYHIRVLFAFKEGVDLTLYVLLTNNLQATCNNFHLKEWVQNLKLLLDLHKDTQFPFKGNRTIFIKNHSKYLLPFDHCNHLLDQAHADLIENSFKEVGVVIQFQCHHEFWLEILPDIVALLRRNRAFSEQDEIVEIAIKLSG